MWRLLRRAAVGVGVLAAMAALGGAIYQGLATRRDLGAVPAPGRLVDVGGHRLHIWCTGGGEPTVVLETGLNGSAFDWGHVQPAVARFARVCSYDRAGMGYSDAGPRPRTSRRIADELARLLNGSGIRGRVVLVGASSGGWNVRLFASTYTDRVAGLVLVDARHEDTTERLAAAGVAENPPWLRWAARALPVAAAVGVARLTGFSPTTRVDALAPDVRAFARATRFRTSAFSAGASEMLHGADSAAQVRSSRRVLDVPLVVVSAGRRSRATRVLGAAIDTLQRDQVGLSRRACQVIARRARHAVALDQPEVVVEAIRSTIEAARSNSATPDCNSIAQPSP